MTGFAFHKAAVKFSHVFVVQAFAQSFKTFAAAGFNQRHDKHLV